jgi:hypothetical protein
MVRPGLDVALNPPGLAVALKPDTVPSSGALLRVALGDANKHVDVLHRHVEPLLALAEHRKGSAGGAGRLGEHLRRDGRGNARVTLRRVGVPRHPHLVYLEEASCVRRRHVKRRRPLHDGLLELDGARDCAVHVKQVAQAVGGARDGGVQPLAQISCVFLRLAVEEVIDLDEAHHAVSAAGLPRLRRTVVRHDDRLVRTIGVVDGAGAVLEVAHPHAVEGRAVREVLQASPVAQALAEAASKLVDRLEGHVAVGGAGAEHELVLAAAVGAVVAPLACVLLQGVGRRRHGRREGPEGPRHDAAHVAQLGSEAREQVALAAAVHRLRVLGILRAPQRHPQHRAAAVDAVSLPLTGIAVEGRELARAPAVTVAVDPLPAVRVLLRNVSPPAVAPALVPMPDVLAVAAAEHAHAVAAPAAHLADVQAAAGPAQAAQPRGGVVLPLPDVLEAVRPHGGAVAVAAAVLELAGVLLAALKHDAAEAVEPAVLYVAHVRLLQQKLSNALFSAARVHFVTKWPRAYRTAQPSSTRLHRQKFFFATTKVFNIRVKSTLSACAPWTAGPACSPRGCEPPRVG